MEKVDYESKKLFQPAIGVRSTCSLVKIHNIGELSIGTS